MNWTGQWLQNSVGSWLGSNEPAAPGVIAARITGTSSVTAGLSVVENQPFIIDIAATLSGSSSFSCDAAVIDNNAPAIFGGRLLLQQLLQQRRKPVFVNVSAALAGSGTLSADITATIVTAATLSGSAALYASPIYEFNFRKNRQRREEEIITAWLMAA